MENLMGANSNRDWKNDFEHENGNYQNKCSVCKQLFFGHKRRVVCFECFVKPPNKEERSLQKVIIVTALVLAVSCAYLFYSVGFMMGNNSGYVEAMDSVINAVALQAKSDTTITKMVLVQPEKDTVVFFMEKK